MPETKRKYDPVKRKEYYERTKQLKGRKKSPKEIKKERDKQQEYIIDELGKRMKKLREQGKEDSKEYISAEVLLSSVIATRLGGSQTSPHSGRYINDNHGNLIELPSDVSNEQFKGLKTTASNDLLPDLPSFQNPLKKIEIQSPFKKKAPAKIKDKTTVDKQLEAYLKRAR